MQENVLGFVGRSSVSKLEENCTWVKSNIPDERLLEKAGLRPTWFLFRKRFVTHVEFKEQVNSFRFFVGEADSFDAYLNKHFIGRHGNLPPNYRYGRVFSPNILIPSDKLKAIGHENELVLLIYGLGLTRIGVSRGPIGIFKYEDAHLLGQMFTAEIVILPMLCALGLLMLLGLGLVQYLHDRSAILRVYLWHAGFSAMALLSMTRLPRQYFDIRVTYNFHFFTRIIYEIPFYLLVEHIFEKKTAVRKVIIAVMGPACIILLINAFLRGQLFDTHGAYVLVKSCMVLAVAPHVMGLIFALQQRGANIASSVLAPVFAITLLLQIHDLLSFWGFLTERYYFRSYPFVIALAVGYVIWQRHSEARHRLELEASFGRIAAQVAHDIRSPLAALRMLASTIRNLGAEETAILNLTVGRISGIADDLRQQVGVAAEPKKTEALTIAQIVRMLEQIVQEKVHEFQGQPGIKIGVIRDSVEAADSVLVNVDSKELARVISNLVNNAAEAIDGSGVIEIGVAIKKRSPVIYVKDNGRGIPREHLESLGQRGATFGKEKGTGLGLFHARETLNTWNAKLVIESEEGLGTLVSIQF